MPTAADEADVLVLPAASKPSISRRISFDPNILPITFDICPPIVVPDAERKRARAGGVLAGYEDGVRIRGC